ncbi:MAG: ABC transporter substrate binding protein [Geobacteraceae bacterium]|nr:ABC transporter substrate binding protein [Geobacteraceae bacterium]
MPIAILYAVICTLLMTVPCHAADVLIIADAQLKPVMEVTQGMRKTLHASTRTYSPAEVHGNLAAILKQEDARVVVALGHEALGEALTLPPAVPVIYDMVITPPAVSRPNTAGFYMATPVSEYAALLRHYLPALRHVAVVSSRDFLNTLANNVSAPLSTFPVRNTVEFVKRIKEQDNADAILLLPDSAIMSATAMQEAYLLSYRRRIPLLGISERHVKEGALLALVVDMAAAGKVIGEYAARALKSGSVGHHPALPPRKFDLFINLDTARKMRIAIPDEVVRMATRTYP